MTHRRRPPTRPPSPVGAGPRRPSPCSSTTTRCCRCCSATTTAIWSGSSRGSACACRAAATGWRSPASRRGWTRRRPRCRGCGGGWSAGEGVGRADVEAAIRLSRRGRRSAAAAVRSAGDPHAARRGRAAQPGPGGLHGGAGLAARWCSASARPAPARPISRSRRPWPCCRPARSTASCCPARRWRPASGSASCPAT